MKENLKTIMKKREGGPSGGYTWFGVKIELLIRLAIAAALFIAGLIVSNSTTFMLLSFLISGYDVIFRALVRIANEKTFGEELIITLAAVLAFVINAGYEAAAVMIIYQAGFALRAYAMEITRNNLEDRVIQLPAEFTVLRDDEKVTIDSTDIQVDEILIVQPGDTVPVDCEVTMGESSVDLFALLGHTSNREVREGDAISAGAVNVSAEIRVRATSTLNDSAFAQAMAAVSDENSMPSAVETSIGRYSAVFAPFTIGICILVALVLMIFTSVSTEEAIHRALIVLIIACPTAMWVPIPLIYLAGLFRSLKHGVAVKGAAVLDSVSKTGAVVFDKDDLLSSEEFRVSAVRSDKLDPNVLLKVAAHAAIGSSRSESVAIVNAYEGIIDNSLIQRFEEIGSGIAAVIDGVVITMGGQSTMARLGVTIPSGEEGDPYTIFLALNGRYAGSIQLTRTIRTDAQKTVNSIEASGCDCIMLSDDTPENTRLIAAAAGIREFYGQCTPMDHLEKLQEIKERYPVNSVLYIGTDTTDTSTLDAADIGVCINGLRSPIALQTGSVVVLDSVADSLTDAVEAGKATRKTVRTTLTAVIVMKCLLFALSLFGITYQMWFAAMVDVIVGMAGILCSTSVWKNKE